MRYEKIVHQNVRPDGTLPEGGAIETRPIIRMSTGEGCGLIGCHCSDGYWISIGSGRRPDGTVEIVRVVFKDRAEIHEFLETHAAGTPTKELPDQFTIEVKADFLNDAYQKIGKSLEGRGYPIETEFMISDPKRCGPGEWSASVEIAHFPEPDESGPSEEIVSLPTGVLR